MRGFFSLLNRFRADERGVFAVIFGLLAIVLVAMAGAAVDYTSMETARNKMQIALDSAALGLAPKIHDNNEDVLRTLAEELVVERLNDSSLTVTVDSADSNTATGTLKLVGSITVPMAFVQLVGISSMTTRISAEATRSSTNLEIAVAVDVTGSMGQAAGGSYVGSKLDALKEGITALIPIVINDVQTPTYSKMALAPYSMGVNVGSYAASARGAIAPGKSITGASWTNGTLKDISGISRASTAVVTSSGHGFATNDYVYIYDVSNMWQVNDKVYKVGTTTANTFQLKNVDGTPVNSTGYNSYQTSSNDKVQRCLIPTCEVVVTAPGHGFVNNQYVHIVDVLGMTQINGKTFSVTYRDADKFALTGVIGKKYGAYTSGGNAYCTQQGCEFLRFQNPSNEWRTHRISTCVSERTTNAYTDAAPSTTLLGRNYPASGNPCLQPQILPLTSNKDTLTTALGALSAGGSTAGHTGLAWAWYLISPNFASLFPTSSQPASYEAPNTLKILILMTDGEYNSSYCDGVISQSSTSGSGSASDHINCNAPNGSSWSQSGSLCTEMKKKVVVYTIGYNVDSAPAAASLMAGCASEADGYYTPNTAAELVAAFTDIGQRISDLRLSQ